MPGYQHPSVACIEGSAVLYKPVIQVGLYRWKGFLPIRSISKILLSQHPLCQYSSRVDTIILSFSSWKLKHKEAIFIHPFFQGAWFQIIAWDQEHGFLSNSIGVVVRFWNWLVSSWKTWTMLTVQDSVASQPVAWTLNPAFSLCQNSDFAFDVAFRIILARSGRSIKEDCWWWWAGELWWCQGQRKDWKQDAEWRWLCLLRTHAHFLLFQPSSPPNSLWS